MRRLIVPTMFMLLFGAMACGGGTDDPSPAAGGAGTPGSSDPPPAAEGGSSEWCDAMQNFADTTAALTTAILSDDADALSAAVEADRAALADAVAVAPPEIKADMEVFQGAMLTIMESIASTEAVPETIEDPFAAEGVSQAGERIGAYGVANGCEVSMDGIG